LKAVTMKKKHNIEKFLEDFRSSYSIPNNYFEDLETEILSKSNTSQKSKSGKAISFKSNFTKIIIAASVLLMVFIGIQKFSPVKNNESFKTDSLVVSRESNLQTGDELFDDISDDEIIEYLAENAYSEDIY